MAAYPRINVVRHPFTYRFYKLSMHRQFAPICLLAALCFPVWSYAQPVQRPPEQKASPQSDGHSTAATPPALALEHMPSHLPTVTFHNGELSIVAYNSTLRDILEMVRSQTGATIDIPPDANERVVVQLGPGPARQVLASLLAGSDFNFVVLNSDTDPLALTKVVLSPKAGTAAGQESSKNAALATPNGIGSSVVRRRPGA
jgi:hypothetical protein